MRSTTADISVSNAERLALAMDEPWTSVFEACGSLIEGDPDLESYHAEMELQRSRRVLSRRKLTKHSAR